MAQAQAQVKTRTVERIVTEEVEETQYVLTLTEDEAALLRGLVGNVNGGRNDVSLPGQISRRGITDAIWNALLKAGVPSTDNPYADGDALLSSDPWQVYA